MQDNYSTTHTLVVHPDFFEDGGRNLNHSDSEIDDCK